MDFIPPPNRENFESQEEYELALKEWEKEFIKAKKHIIEDEQLWVPCKPFKALIYFVHFSYTQSRKLTKITYNQKRANTQIHEEDIEQTPINN